MRQVSQLSASTALCLTLSHSVRWIPSAHRCTSHHTHINKLRSPFEQAASLNVTRSTNLFTRLTRTFASMATELAPKEAPAGMELATFAGGCFWGLELAFQRVVGVSDTSVGYTQGKVANPFYEQVCSGKTGHTEAVQVTYNPKEVGFDVLLDTFFERTDPTTLNRQGNDAGTQYRSGIYYHSASQKEAAEKAMADVQRQIDAGTFRKTAEKKIQVELLPAGDYYLAEDYHQHYLEKGGRYGHPFEKNFEKCDCDCVDLVSHSHLPKDAKTPFDVMVDSNLKESGMIGHDWLY